MALSKTPNVRLQGDANSVSSMLAAIFNNRDEIIKAKRKSGDKRKKSAKKSGISSDLVPSAAVGVADRDDGLVIQCVIPGCSEFEVQFGDSSDQITLGELNSNSLVHLELPNNGDEMVNKNDEIVLYLENLEPSDEGEVQVIDEQQNVEVSSGNLEPLLINFEQTEGDVTTNELALQIPNLQYEFELPQYFGFKLEAPSSSSHQLQNQEVLITDKSEVNLGQSAAAGGQGAENFSDLLLVSSSSQSPPLPPQSPMSKPQSQSRRKRKPTVTINPAVDLNKKPKFTETFTPETLQKAMEVVKTHKGFCPSSASGSSSSFKEKPKLICPDCKLFFDCNLALDRHFKYSLSHVSPEAQLTCAACAKSFGSLLSRINHDEAIHPEMFVRYEQTEFPTIKCDDCGHEFYARNGYNQHLPKCGFV